MKTRIFFLQNITSFGDRISRYLALKHIRKLLGFFSLLNLVVVRKDVENFVVKPATVW